MFNALALLARCGGTASSRRIHCASWLAGHCALLARPDLLGRDLRNLAIALGPSSGVATRLNILRISLVTSARSAIRALACVVHPMAYRCSLNDLTVTGREHLDESLAAGGVVAVSAHLGDFARTVLWLAHAGYPVTMTIREAKHVPPGLYRDAFTVLGVEAVVVDSDRQTTQTLMRALRAGRIVVIYLDQDAKKGGLDMTFLGKRTPIPTGPAVLAQRTGATLLPMFSIDQHGGAGRIDILRGLRPTMDPNRTAAISADTERLATIVESYIRRYPQQWGWRYRRWRNRPLVPQSVTDNPVL